MAHKWDATASEMLLKDGSNALNAPKDSSNEHVHLYPKEKISPVTSVFISLYLC